MSGKAQYDVIRIFIASPGDLTAERTRFREVLDEVNRTKAHPIGVHLEPLGWEDTLPGKGRPQELINADVRQADVFVLLLWKRWGTPTGEFTSGVEEEFVLAQELNDSSAGRPYILLYFRDIPEDMLADPGEQLSKVIAFRTSVEAARAFFYSRFASPDEWARKFTEHLCRWLDDRPPLDHPASQVIFAFDVEKQLRALEKKIDSLSRSEPGEARDKPESGRQIALAHALDAIKSARDGRFTEAHVHFARSLAAYDDPEVVYAYAEFMHEIGRDDLLDEVHRKRRESATPADVAAALSTLGTFSARRGDLEEAAYYYRRALGVVELRTPIQYYSVFLSYSSQDEEFVSKLHADLSASGLRCWYAPEDLRIGDRFRTRIDEAIRIHDTLLVVLSRASVGSSWVEAEVETAFARERAESRTVLFPITLDDGIFNASGGWSSYLLHTRQIGDFRNWHEPNAYALALERLVSSLKRETVARNSGA